MNFLHRALNLSAGDVVEVTLDNAANVQLLDQTNYEAYKSGQSYQYQVGGYVKESPVRLEVPTTGSWHLTVDLGGGAGRVRASYRVLNAQPA